MTTARQILARRSPRCFESRAAFLTDNFRMITAATGRQPHAAIEDHAGNCLVCGEAGRCPGWHLAEEFERAGVEPFRLEVSA